MQYDQRGYNQLRKSGSEESVFSFPEFRVGRTQGGDSVLEQVVNEKAAAKLQAELELKLKSIVMVWNECERADAEGTLLIKPEIQEIKYVSGSSRF